MNYKQLNTYGEILDCITRGYEADEDNILAVHTSGGGGIDECAKSNVEVMQKGYAESQTEFYETDIGFFCIAYNPLNSANDLYLFYVYPEQRHRKQEQLEVVKSLSRLPLWACIPYKNEKCNRFYKNNCKFQTVVGGHPCYLLRKRGDI